jgi:hypothetical protein
MYNGLRLKTRWKSNYSLTLPRRPYPQKKEIAILKKLSAKVLGIDDRGGIRCLLVV